MYRLGTHHLQQVQRKLFSPRLRNINSLKTINQYIVPISEIIISATDGKTDIRGITYPKLSIKYYNFGAFGHDVIACSGLEEVSVHIVFPSICWKRGVLNKPSDKRKSFENIPNGLFKVYL